MSWFTGWFRSRTFWGVVMAAVPGFVADLQAASGDATAIAAAIAKFAGVILAAMGVRGAILKSGGLKG